MTRATKRGQGFTLIELVVALVIIAMAGMTAIGLMSSNASRSAEAMVQAQAVNVADTYLQEVLSKPFTPVAPVCGATRAAYNDVDDYRLCPINDVGVRDQNGVAIVGLDGYTVNVLVEQFRIALVPNARSVPLADGRRITVTVTSADGTRTILRAYKARHP